MCRRHLRNSPGGEGGPGKERDALGVIFSHIPQGEGGVGAQGSPGPGEGAAMSYCSISATGSGPGGVIDTEEDAYILFFLMFGKNGFQLPAKKVQELLAEARTH